MKKKGFTLIELLAVIVILAVIALIAVPIILNVIEKAKKGAAESSALGYIDAVEKSVGIGTIDSTKGIIVPSDNDLSLENEDDIDILEKILVKGTKPDYVSLQFKKGKIISGSFCINNYSFDYDGKEIKDTKSNYCTGINVKDVKILNTETEIDLLDTLKLNIKIEAVDNNYTTIYTSSDDNIATISNDGLITPIAKGNVTFTVKVGYRRDSITLNVSDKCALEVGKEYAFDYTGGVQEFNTICPGNYKLETWGAQGGDNTYGGKGGYAYGNANLLENSKLYVVVGGQGKSPSHGCGAGGYNGGGNGCDLSSGGRFSGGGATHIANRSGILSSLANYKSDILIVAAGGGGGKTSEITRYGGAGGGLTGSMAGNSISSGRGGTQTSGGSGMSSDFCTSTAGTFGQGGNGCQHSSGGGGGYYGGGGGTRWGNDDGTGGGGSSYIGGVSGGSTTAGVRAGNGYAKITYLGK